MLAPALKVKGICRDKLSFWSKTCSSKRIKSASKASHSRGKAQPPSNQVTAKRELSQQVNVPESAKVSISVRCSVHPSKNSRCK